jgi:hypothetical protein
MKEKIAHVRSRIAELKKEHTATQAQRKSRKEVGTNIDESIDYWSATAYAILETNMARAAAGYPAEFLTAHVRGMSVDLGPLFVLLVGPDAVRTALNKGLATVPEGLDAPARGKRLHELVDALYLAQMEEETLIREAEQAGKIIPYRPDADPRYAITRMSE